MKLVHHYRRNVVRGGEDVLRLCQREPHLGNLEPDNSLIIAARRLRIDLAGNEPVPIEFAALSHA